MVISEKTEMKRQQSKRKKKRKKKLALTIVIELISVAALIVAAFQIVRAAE